MATRTTKVPPHLRVRRKPEVGEREILDAAEEILKKKDFRDLTVDAVMGRTGMVRSAFYNYFENRSELIMRLIERVEGEMMEVSQAWLEDSSDDPIRGIAESLERVAEIYAEHGHLLRAVHEASYHDREVERYYRGGLLQNFTDAVASRLREEKAAGRTSIEDPKATATALLLLNANFFVERLGAGSNGHGASPRAVASTLIEIWVRTIYLTAP
jgi:AcrR family transcriptional regulator